MISRSELNPKGVPLTADMLVNFELSYKVANLVRAKYDRPMIITSGVRSLGDHKRIYIEKAKREGKKTFRVPMGSKHLVAAAWDVQDSDGSLYKWCEANEEFLRSVGVWLERGTIGWVHMQVLPYGSFKPGGSIWFNP